MSKQLQTELKRIEERLSVYQQEILQSLIDGKTCSTSEWGFELLRALRRKGLIELVHTRDYGEGLYIEYYAITEQGLQALKGVRS